MDYLTPDQAHNEIKAHQKEMENIFKTSKS